MQKILIFFTSDFPYGISETFIENEYPYLSRAFDKIIFITNNIKDNNLRIPAYTNYEIIRLPYHLKTNVFIGLLNVFSKAFIAEFISYISKNKTVLPKRTALNAMINSLYKEKKYTQKLIKQLKPLIGENTPVIYSYWMTDMAMIANSLKQYYKKSKSIIRAHRWDLYEEVNENNYLPYRNRVVNKADSIICISSDGKQYLDKKHIQYASKIHVSRLGTVNTSVLKIVEKTNRLSIVSCSRIISNKRVDLLIKALSESTINIDWQHYGSGKLDLEIRNLAQKELDNKENISYKFYGDIENKELLSYYKQTNFDVFINVSSSEGLPVSIMEAMSFGIPVIATDVGGTSEIVEHKTNGLLLPANPTVEEVLQAMVYFYMYEPNVRAEMQRAAYNTWQKKYNAENNYPAFIQQYLK